MRKTGKTGKSNRMRQEASYMAAKEQLTAMEMIWGIYEWDDRTYGKDGLCAAEGSVRGILHLRRHIFRV